MLVELSIRNFALIPSLTISFQKGLHVLTGETGAGKSIIVDAISLLIGGRASVEYIRQGAKKAEIEGLFHVPKEHPLFTLCQDLGIEVEEDAFILRRDISIQGKSICRINGKLVTLAMLREAGRLLVDIHGQHEYQRMLHEENHLSLIDEFGKEMLKANLDEYTRLYSQFKEINRAIRQLTESEQQLAQRQDLLRFQLQEIASAHLEPEEDQLLQQERQKRMHSQKLHRGIEQSYTALYADGRALDSLGLVLANLQDLEQIDEELKPTTAILQQAYYQLEEVGYQLKAYRENIDFDPERLNQIESRLYEIERLKRKYGKNVKEILIYAAEIEDELDSLDHKEERLEKLLRNRKEIVFDLILEAQQLSELRKQIATQLAQELKQELKGLFMERTELEIKIVPRLSGEKIDDQGQVKYITERGWDEVLFLIAPNPGEGLKPLSKIASGGELSRLILALKSIFAQTESITTLIFDEVDTGVSGRVAQAMAERLYRISRAQQVLCITHHAQVAAMADEHYQIKKEVRANQTQTLITPLPQLAKIDELARIMSGVEVTELTKQHAQELIDLAERIKMTL